MANKYYHQIIIPDLGQTKEFNGIADSGIKGNNKSFLQG